MVRLSIYLLIASLREGLFGFQNLALAFKVSPCVFSLSCLLYSFLLLIGCFKQALDVFLIIS